MIKNRPTTRELAKMRAEGMTQAKIGEKYGVSHTAVYHWIQADRKHFDTIFSIYKRKLARTAEARRAREIRKIEAELEAQHEE